MAVVDAVVGAFEPAATAGPPTADSRSSALCRPVRKQFSKVMTVSLV
jgi:hypothetical protein